MRFTPLSCRWWKALLQQAAVQLDLIQEGLRFEDFLVPGNCEGGRVGVCRPRFQSFVNLSHAIGGRELRRKVEVFSNLREGDVVIALVGIVRYRFHFNWKGNVLAHDIGEAQDLEVVRAHVEDFPVDFRRIALEDQQERLRSVPYVNERSPLLAASQYKD